MQREVLLMIVEESIMVEETITVYGKTARVPRYQYRLVSSADCARARLKLPSAVDYRDVSHIELLAL